MCRLFCSFTVLKTLHQMRKKVVIHLYKTFRVAVLYYFVIIPSFHNSSKMAITPGIYLGLLTFITCLGKFIQGLTQWKHWCHVGEFETTNSYALWLIVEIPRRSLVSKSRNYAMAETFPGKTEFWSFGDHRLLWDLIPERRSIPPTSPQTMELVSSQMYT